MIGQKCNHRRCRFHACSAQVECYCGHAKEQHRRGGRHKCAATLRLRPLCPCLAYAPRYAHLVRVPLAAGDVRS